MRLLVESVLSDLDLHRGNEELLLRLVTDVRLSSKLAKTVGLAVCKRYQQAAAASASAGTHDLDGGRVQRLREYTREVMAAVDHQHPRSMDQVFQGHVYPLYGLISLNLCISSPFFLLFFFLFVSFSAA